MSGSKKANSFLKECMADALISLMKTGDYSKITVNEIARSAGVNRSTWFRNFGGKGEALSFKLVCLWYRWMEERGMGEYLHYTVENAGDFFAFCHANREMLDLFMDCGLETVIYEAFYQIMVPQFEAGPAERYSGRFYSYGLFGIFGEWSHRGYRESPEELVELFYSMTGYNK